MHILVHFSDVEEAILFNSRGPQIFPSVDSPCVSVHTIPSEHISHTPKYFKIFKKCKYCSVVEGEQKKKEQKKKEESGGFI